MTERPADPRPGDEPQRAKALDTREFEAVLTRRHEALVGDIRRELDKHRGEQYEDLIQAAADAEDWAIADLVVDTNLSEISRDADELRAVQAAIGRIKAGSYGICLRCGQRIDLDRLRAIPETELCIECQARAEEHRAETPSL